MLCHAEALPFLRDPYAFDDEEPFGQMMTAPIREQMYKAATGFAIMACLAVACIHVPVQLAKAISPGLFPLHLKVSCRRTRFMIVLPQIRQYSGMRHCASHANV